MRDPAARRRLLRRAWVYSLLIALLGCAASYLHRSPQRDLDGLVAVAGSSSGGRFFRHEAAVVGFHAQRGWTLTLYVGDTSRFAPAEFLVLRRLDGKLDGELLTEPGGERKGALGSLALQGAPLDEYLLATGLDLSGLDALLEARLAAAGK